MSTFDASTGEWTTLKGDDVVSLQMAVLMAVAHTVPVDCSSLAGRVRVLMAGRAPPVRSPWKPPATAVPTKMKVSQIVLFLPQL